MRSHRNCSFIEISRLSTYGCGTCIRQKKKNIFNLEKNKIDQASGYFNNIIIGFRYTYFGNQLVYEQQKKLSKCLFSPLDLMTYEKKSHDNIIFNWHNRIGFCTVKGWVQFYDREASCSYFRFLLEFVLLELLFFYFVLLFSVFKYFCEFHTTACYLHVPHILEIVCCSWRSHHYTIVVQNTIVFLAIWFWNGRFFSVHDWSFKFICVSKLSNVDLSLRQSSTHTLMHFRLSYVMIYTLVYGTHLVLSALLTMTYLFSF